MDKIKNKGKHTMFTKIIQFFSKSDSDVNLGFTSETSASVTTKGLTDGALEGPGGKPWSDGR